MATICPYALLTFYPGDYPSEENPLALLSSEHRVPNDAALRAAISQLIQRAEYVRGSTPGLFVRGQKSLNLTWQEVRLVNSPGEALVIALDIAVDLPTTTGWLLIDIPDQGRKFGVSPVAIELADTAHNPLKNRINLTWQLATGEPFKIAVEAPAFAITTEAGFALGTENGDYLVTEEAT